MENIREVVTANLISLRKASHFTQIELAEKVKYSDKAVSRWENGESTPDVETLQALADIYNVPIAYFFETHEDPEIMKKEMSQRQKEIVVASLAVSVIWLIATVIFVYLMAFKKIVYWQVFVWALPASSLSVSYFNYRKWHSHLLSAILQSFSVWSVIAGIYLQFISLNMWLIFLIGVPIEVAIILIYYIKSRK